jgi:hypothetical protein
MAHITYKQYWEEVVDLMLTVIDETKAAKTSFEVADWEKAASICGEITDNHEWTIYTFKSQFVLLHTDNANAYFDHFGALTVDSPSEFFLKVAGYALYSDVWDMLCRYMAALENAA